ncbi:MAG TPA: hypothetical protein VHC20_05585 [Candidatus Paceibacterota bacterium]|nr:hypothetical protein [Candidatus Paceibacterota bacterium]
MRPFAPTSEDEISITDASQILGLEPFNVYSLIQRRKLNADRTLSGELVIQRTEIDRALGKRVGPEMPET